MEQQLRKQLITSIVLLFLVISFAAVITVAWLAGNRDTNSNGMEMDSEVTANLVISSSATDIKSSLMSTINGGSPYKVTETVAAGELAPATHDGNYTVFAEGLKYVTNKSDVGFRTGIAKKGYTYAPVDDSGYYIDYVVYIASYGAEMSGSKLQAAVSGATKDSVEVTEGTMMAASVDFYLGDVSSDTYLGTSNVAEKQPVYVIGSADTTGTIPLNTSDSLKITMRCYFDGELSGDEGETTYVNSATLDTDNVIMKVNFTATTP